MISTTTYPSHSIQKVTGKINNKCNQSKYTSYLVLPAYYQTHPLSAIKGK